MSIIKDAQKYLAHLNIDQWQDGYPNQTQIELDIKNNDSYVIVNIDNLIIGTTVFLTNNSLLEWQTSLGICVFITVFAFGVYLIWKKWKIG